MCSLLRPNGLMVFDIWSDNCDISFDPKFSIQKSNPKEISQILKQLG